MKELEGLNRLLEWVDGALDYEVNLFEEMPYMDRDRFETLQQVKEQAYLIKKIYIDNKATLS